MWREKGQTLVEFALILPILLLVLFVIIESGRIFQAYITVQHAAREGARYAVTGRWEEEFADVPVDEETGLGGPRVTSIEDVARNALSGLPIAGEAGYDEDGGILINHYEIKIFGQNPNPDGPPLIENYAGRPNEKVAVQVAYRLELLTPVLNVIAPSVEVKGYVEMINEDFGQLSGGGFPGLREPPSPIPPHIPTAGASPTPTNTATPTDTPTPLPATDTPTPTSTPACEIEIVEPVSAVDTTVTVTGDPGDLIEIWDLDTGVLIGTGTVGPGGYCDGSAAVGVNGNLVDGHMIAALSTRHPSFDTACVGTCWITSTPTATGTATPTGTPTPTATNTPTGPYIALDHTCSSEGQAVNIAVSGYNWLANPNKDILVQWDGATKQRFPSRVNWSTSINISASEATSGTHTVKAFIASPLTEDSKDVVIPCPPTPAPTTTATPLRPDLVITDFTVSPDTGITAYVPVTFTVDIRNDGPGDALSLFWVDLYDLPAGSGPPTAGQSQGDVTWKAVSSLSAGGTDTVVLYYAFTEPGTRVLYSYVDARQNIDETPYEDNNASQPLALNITAGSPPTYTLALDPVCSAPDQAMNITVSGEGWPTGQGDITILWDSTLKDTFSPTQANWSRVISIDPSEATSRNHTIQASIGTTHIRTKYYVIPCTDMGAIDGYTRLFLPGVGIVFQERTDVYCRDAGGDLIAQTTSGDYGYYVLESIPPGGPYTVIGKADIDDVLYMDTATGIAVTAGITERVNLLLLPQY
jgi:hypothetical protein